MSKKGFQASFFFTTNATAFSQGDVINPKPLHQEKSWASCGPSNKVGNQPIFPSAFGVPYTPRSPLASSSNEHAFVKNAFQSDSKSPTQQQPASIFQPTTTEQPPVHPSLSLPRNNFAKGTTAAFYSPTEIIVDQRRDRMLHISAMPEFAQKSPEELRYEDYSRECKGLPCSYSSHAAPAPDLKHWDRTFGPPKQYFGDPKPKYSGQLPIFPGAADSYSGASLFSHPTSSPFTAAQFPKHGFSSAPFAAAFRASPLTSESSGGLFGKPSPGYAFTLFGAPLSNSAASGSASLGDGAASNNNPAGKPLFGKPAAANPQSNATSTAPAVFSPQADEIIPSAASSTPTSTPLFGAPNTGDSIANPTALGSNTSSRWNRWLDSVAPTASAKVPHAPTTLFGALNANPTALASSTSVASTASAKAPHAFAFSTPTGSTSDATPTPFASVAKSISLEGSTTLPHCTPSTVQATSVSPPLFGSSEYPTTSQGSQVVPFQPETVKQDDCILQFQHICSMPQNSDKCAEELRFEDYKVNRKGQSGNQPYPSVHPSKIGVSTGVFPRLHA